MTTERAQELRRMYFNAGGASFDWDKSPRMVVPLQQNLVDRIERFDLDLATSPVLRRVEFERRNRPWSVVSAGSKPVSRTFEAWAVVAEGMIIDAAYYDPEQAAWVQMPEQVGETAPR